MDRTTARHSGSPRQRRDVTGERTSCLASPGRSDPSSWRRSHLPCSSTAPATSPSWLLSSAAAVGSSLWVLAVVTVAVLNLDAAVGLLTPLYVKRRAGDGQLRALPRISIGDSGAAGIVVPACLEPHQPHRGGGHWRGAVGVPRPSRPPWAGGLHGRLLVLPLLPSGGRAACSRAGRRGARIDATSTRQATAGSRERARRGARRPRAGWHSARSSAVRPGPSRHCGSPESQRPRPIS